MAAPPVGSNGPGVMGKMLFSGGGGGNQGRNTRKWGKGAKRERGNGGRADKMEEMETTRDVPKTKTDLISQFLRE